MSELPPFQTPALLARALTHRSYLNEHPEEGGEDNERLEFLGDAVLGFAIAELLYKHYPDLPEGDLTRRRARLVDEKQLAQLAQQLDLGSVMRLGRGAEKEGGRQKPSLLSDTFEAVLGAYYLDSGIEAVRGYIESLFAPIVESTDFQHLSPDPKSLFQQWVLTQIGRQNPRYLIVSEVGPDHNKEFAAQVLVLDEVYGVGVGKTKQEAEKQAALEALKRLGVV
jgi:ribonuclease-3